MGDPAVRLGEGGGVPGGCAVRTITARKDQQLVSALASLCGEVDGELSAAVAAHWKTLDRKIVAESALAERLKAPNDTIRRFIQRYLQLQGYERVVVRNKQWYINYAKESKPRETFAAHLAFEVILAPGLSIDVRVTPHYSATKERAVDVLIKALDRVQRMVEAAR
jgi:hypothetical protein